MKANKIAPGSPTTRFFLMVLTLLTLFALPAQTRADGFDEEVASVYLLQNKAVQKEIGLTEAERSKMNVFADAHREKLNAYYADLYRQHKQIDQAGQQKLLGWFADLKRNVLAELRPDQIKRLRELSLQAMGFPALGDQTVGTRVGLNEIQLKKIRSILESTSKQAMTIQDNAVERDIADLKGENPKTDKEKKALESEAEKRAAAARQRVEPEVNRIRLKAKGEIMAILTADQRQKWQDLLGKPFHG